MRGVSPKIHLDTNLFSRYLKKLSFFMELALMIYKPENPVIVQSDRSILLEVDNQYFIPARNALSKFAELEKSPEHIHTYRISPLSLWNAASLGLTSEQVTGDLERFSKYDIPQNIYFEIAVQMSRYGKLKLTSDGDMLRIES